MFDISEQFCAGCVWWDKKSQSCDVTGRCVRRMSGEPPPHDYDADDYDLFPHDEIARLKRQYRYEMMMEE